MAAKFCVYTVLLGNYEDFNEQPVAKDSAIDFFCFTDDPALQSSTWKLIRVEPILPMDHARMGNTGLVLNTWTRFDHATGKSTSWHVDEVSSLQEPQFVPRRPGAPEGDGYLMGLVNRHVDLRSELLVLDANHLADGPIASVRLPFKLRNGIHGTWVPGELLS